MRNFNPRARLLLDESSSDMVNGLDDGKNQQVFSVGALARLVHFFVFVDDSSEHSVAGV